MTTLNKKSYMTKIMKLHENKSEMKLKKIPRQYNVLCFDYV